MPEDDQILKAILNRLNIVIALQLEGLPVSASTSITDKIRKLSALGLSPAETGAIVGKKANYVSAVLGGKEKRSRA